MISKLGDHPTELDLLAAKSVPGTIFSAGIDTVSEVLPDEVRVVFQVFS
jgi:hypothetical protein